MRKIICILILMLPIQLCFSQSPVTRILLDTGEEIRFLTQAQIDADWKQDFESISDLLSDNQQISDYLDGSPGFSPEEKAYWICYYAKSNNIKALTDNDTKKLSYLRIYYLQGIILRSTPETNGKLNEALDDTIFKIYPQWSSYRTISIIRQTSCKEYLSGYLNGKLEQLSDSNSKNIISKYFIAPNEQNREMIIKHLNNKLSRLEKGIEDLQNYIANKKEISNPQLANDPEIQQTLNNEENKMRNVIKELKTQSNLFFSIIIQTNDPALIKEASTLQTTFYKDLTDKYPDASR